MAAKTRIGTRTSWVGPGNFAIAIRSSPYTAALDTTPESTAETSGGASRYASGSQPWKGKRGALTAKAATNPRKIQVFPLVPVSTRSKLPWWIPRTITAASISSEPAIV